MKILITGHDTFHNKGCQALIYTTTKILKDVFPDADFDVFSWEPEYDSRHFNNNSVKCNFIRHKFQVNEFSNRNKLWLRINEIGIKTDKILRVSHAFYHSIKRSDMVVVSGGDILGDYGESAIKHYFFPIAVASALKKPVYIFAQSISPARNKKLLKFTRTYLNKAALITVRERVSYDYLKSLNIKAPFYLTADPAFLLSTSPEKRVNEILNAEGISGDSGLTVGISVSEALTNWGGFDQSEFFGIMASVCDTLVNKYSAKLIFVPHVTYPDSPRNDDRLIGSKIRDLMTEKQSAFLINGDYSCGELKAVIGKCDIFIGARTHSTIASTSQLIPTLALAYSIKAVGIMEQVYDKDISVLDVKNISKANLLKRIDYLISNHEEIKNHMSAQMEKIVELSRQNGKLAREIFKT